MSKKKLYFYHGFAGDPEDWDAVIAHLSEYECRACSYPFEFPEKGILVGYSMGGRIAQASPLAKMVISGHPGLQTDEEKKERALTERSWIQLLKTVPIDQFFDQWYSQPLLQSVRNSPSFSAILERRLKKTPALLIEQIERHSLVNQPALHRNTIFIHGEYDKTYRDLYNRFKFPAHEIPRAGHACHLENPERTARQIKILMDGLI
jgi:2-succinyl-6-hydroxy-2,4-cyclohexadiene-1-carboxylate synthase